LILSSYPNDFDLADRLGIANENLNEYGYSIRENYETISGLLTKFNNKIDKVIANLSIKYK